MSRAAQQTRRVAAPSEDELLEDRSRRLPGPPRHAGRSPTLGCGACGARAAHLLPGPAGLARCDACGELAVSVAAEQGAARMFRTTTGLVPGRRDGEAVVVLRDEGPVRVWRGRGVVHAAGAAGRVVYAASGHVLVAEGLYAPVWLDAERPVPCDCGSTDVRWVEAGSALESRILHAGAAREPRRPGAGEVLPEAGAVAARAACCESCGQVAVYPTVYAGKATRGGGR